MNLYQFNFDFFVHSNSADIKALDNTFFHRNLTSFKMFPLIPRWHSCPDLFFNEFSENYHRYMQLTTPETTNVLSKSFAVVITIDPNQLPYGRLADTAKDDLKIALDNHTAFQNANVCHMIYFRSHDGVAADKMRLYFPARFSDEEVKSRLLGVVVILNQEIYKATKGG